MIIAENISTPILKGVSLTLKPSSITVCLGPSGAGKTSLLKALSLIDLPLSGSIQIDEDRYDFPIVKREFKSPWPKLTVSFQQQFLWPHLTLKENILLPVGAQATQRLDELIDFFGMSEFINRHPNQTSLGQRQRAALARAVIVNPTYLLLDEITNFLDPEQVYNILELIQKLRDKGLGIFLITHHMRFAFESADQILFMEEGQIIEAGARDFLVKHPTPRLAHFTQLAARI